MFVAMVAHPPVMDDKLDRMSHDRWLPKTSYFWFQISPEPPAFWVMAMTTPTQVTVTTTKDVSEMAKYKRRVGTYKL
jgi:hypothetical protein